MKKRPIPSVLKSQVLRELYTLPLDIKIKIFQMAIKEHMKEWEYKHYNGYYIPLNDIKWMGDVSGNKDTYPWNDQKRQFYLDYFEGLNGRFGSIKLKKNKPCELIKDTSYEVNNNIYEEIEPRRLHYSDLFMVSHKCRCFTCDLVRVAYRLDNLFERSLDQVINKKYARITYYTGDEQWKTMTVSQVKTMREKERREFRNKINRAKQITN